MIEAAQRYNCDAQKLWKYNFGGMKKLVKTLPNACDIIDARLKIENQKKQKNLIEISKRKVRDEQFDEQWAKAVKTSAKKLYEENHRPIRVTKNQLLRASKLDIDGKKELYGQPKNVFQLLTVQL